MRAHPPRTYQQLMFVTIRNTTSNFWALQPGAGPSFRTRERRAHSVPVSPSERATRALTVVSRRPAQVSPDRGRGGSTGAFPQLAPAEPAALTATAQSWTVDPLRV